MNGIKSDLPIAPKSVSEGKPESPGQYINPNALADHIAEKLKLIDANFETMHKEIETLRNRVNNFLLLQSRVEALEFSFGNLKIVKSEKVKVVKKRK
jgi:hypothetical protein